VLTGVGVSVFKLNVVGATKSL